MKIELSFQIDDSALNDIVTEALETAESEFELESVTTKLIEESGCTDEISSSGLSVIPEYKSDHFRLVVNSPEFGEKVKIGPSIMYTDKQQKLYDELTDKDFEFQESWL